MTRFFYLSRSEIWAEILSKDRETPVNLTNNGDSSISDTDPQLYQGESLFEWSWASLIEAQSQYFE